MKINWPNRFQGVEPSATFKYSSKAKKEGIINLTIGRTNFDTPKIIKDAAKKALNEGKIHYTSTRGIPRLRKKIAQKLKEDNDLEANKEKIMVSAGAKNILYQAIHTLVGKGDQVAIPDPAWVSYVPMARLAQAEVKRIPLKPPEFTLDENFFSKLENSEPKLIIINSPSNPTGAVYDKKNLKKVVDIAREKDAWLISDEIYEKLIYEGEHFSPGSIYEKTITVNGFSKEFSMTGWRLGYAHAPKEVIDHMNLIQSQSVSCATSFAQYGALKAFTQEARVEAKKMKEELAERRNYILGRMEEIGINAHPNGSFYLFPQIGEDDLELANKLLDNGVGVVPGSPFGPQGKGCVRISYGAVNKERLGQAIDRIEKTIK